ncbi:MAG: hypothetical protein JNN20_11565 [Betaproteobacteria bacterium]|nr:hypothetical protein [Betaproteobacteria bacterium]
MKRALWRALSVGIFAMVVALPARATNYQDLWWNPNESGWGIQIVQQADTLFLTWFIYNNAGQPTWVVSDGVTRVSSSPNVVYRGRVVAATGTFFGAPTWGGITPRVAGTEVTLTFTDARTGTLTYTVDGTTVTKPITRQNLVPIDMRGTYYGGLLRGSGCANQGVNTTTYSVTHTPTQSPTTGAITGPIEIVEVGGVLCRFTGTTTQFGSIIEASGTYTCAGDGTTGTWTGREGTAGESTFSFKLALQSGSGTCPATIGGFKSP